VRTEIGSLDIITGSNRKQVRYGSSSYIVLVPVWRPVVTGVTDQSVTRRFLTAEAPVLTLSPEAGASSGNFGFPLLV
jgi:hypothetical protein